jgi:hypothetical protein
MTYLFDSKVGPVYIEDFEGQSYIRVKYKPELKTSEIKLPFREFMKATRTLNHYERNYRYKLTGPDRQFGLFRNQQL